jgi:HK97 family phage major capsid protein
MELLEVKEKIAELEREISKKFEDLKAGRLNEADFQERVEKLDKRIVELEKALAETKKPGVQVIDNIEEIKTKAFKKYIRCVSLEPEEKKALVVGTDSGGGYLAPKDWAAEVDRNLILFSPIRSVARVVTTSLRSLLVPRITTYGEASITPESNAITPSDMTFDQVEIVPYKETRAVQISRELLRDNAFNLDGLLAEIFGELFGKLEGKKFVKGTGTGEPEGVTVSTAVTTYTTATSGALAADDVIKCYHSVPQAYASVGTWAMNRNTLLAIRLMKDSQNRYLFVPDVTGATPGTILGRPVIECPDYDDIAASNVVATFGDWKSGFWIVDRQDMEILVADQLYAANGLIGFFAFKRAGGKVVRGEALVNLKIKT